jgi:flagellar hook-associated protein 3 FlgL
MIGAINPTYQFHSRSREQMGELRSSLERLQQQIATGERLARPSDDPASASQLRHLQREDELGEALLDKTRTIGRTITASLDEIGSIADLLARVRELAVAAANGATGADGQASIAAELDILGEELLTRANANHDGRPLFAGTASGPAYATSPGGPVYAGAAEIAAVEVAPGTAIEPGVTGPQLFGIPNGPPGDAFALIANLATALRGGVADPAAAARDALPALSAVEEAASRAQTILGARLAWVDQLQQQGETRSLARAEERSRIGDADLTETIARLQQTLTVLEASQAAFARISALSLFDRL